MEWLKRRLAGQCKGDGLQLVYSLGRDETEPSLLTIYHYRHTVRRPPMQPRSGGRRRFVKAGLLELAALRHTTAVDTSSPRKTTHHHMTTMPLQQLGRSGHLPPPSCSQRSAAVSGGVCESAGRQRTETLDVLVAIA